MESAENLFGEIKHLYDTYQVRHFEILDDIRQMLRAVFQTKNELTLAVSGTGMAGMEACVVNLIEPGDKMFWNVEVAHKYKMSSMQAALGLAQIERIDDLVGRKRQIFNWYQSELGSIEGITLNYEAPDIKNTYWMVTIVLDEKFGLQKDVLMSLMSEKGIDCRPVFHPLSSIPAYQKLEQAKQSTRNKRRS